METKSDRGRALVTGAGSGIGLALAAVIRSEGYRLILCGRDEDKLRRAAADWPEAQTLSCDVREPRSVERAFASLEESGEDLELLVNNAGVARFLNLEDTAETDWEEMIATNLTGAWRMTRHAMPLLLASGGMILNVVSVGGRQAFPGSSAYCASKFGMLGLAEAIRAEFRGRGVRVVNLLPGAVDTPLWDAMEGDWNRQSMLQPEDVAEAARSALRLPKGALVEEIVIRPAGGDL